MATDDKLRELGQDSDDPAFTSPKRPARGRAMAAAKRATYSGAWSLGLMATVQSADPHMDRLAHAVAVDHLWRSGA